MESWPNALETLRRLNSIIYQNLCYLILIKSHNNARKKHIQTTPDKHKGHVV